ncbi:hypothetical protein ACFU7X_46805 [Streptomyces chartreusis]|uniref:hypothetical protein n=1 Tax=Streptomyces chartreusis TaxID=1969 RepID=UPI0036ACB42F
MVATAERIAQAAGGDPAAGHVTGTSTVGGQTLVALPVFCDLLTHVALHLEGDVDIERARRYKTNAFAAHDEIATVLDRASSMTLEQIGNLLAVAITLASGFWQVSHPTPTSRRCTNRSRNGVTSRSTSPRGSTVHSKRSRSDSPRRSPRVTGPPKPRGPGLVSRGRGRGRDRD